MRHILVILPLLLLNACGLDVATTAATEAKLKAKEAEEGKKTMDQFQQKLDAANLAQQASREEVDKAANQ